MDTRFPFTQRKTPPTTAQKRVAMAQQQGKTDFDLIVLGTGPAGSTVAQLCARAGASVAVIESRTPGGTCALRGCNPKKVLALASELVDWSELGQDKLVSGGRLSIDWARLKSFTREFTQPVPDSKREALDEDGIELVVGEPSFVDPNRIRVGERTLSARTICLAIGTRPVVPDLPGIDHAIRSDEFFELDSLPRSLLFAGGGYISMEFASVALRAGASVHVVDDGPRPLAGFEPDLVDALVERSEAAGMAFTRERVLKGIEPIGDGYAATIGTQDSSDSDRSIPCDGVVLGLGRRVDAKGLELECAGVSFDEGIVVNDDLSCRGAKHIFAAGDCAQTDRPHLTMAANLEADVAVAGILKILDLPAPSGRYAADTEAIPSIAFTLPHLGRVGLSEDEARGRNMNIRISSGDRSSSGSVRKRGETHARYKVLVDEDSDLIVGAHFLGPGADELLNLVALAMQCKLTASRLQQAVFAFPTFASEIGAILK